MGGCGLLGQSIVNLSAGGTGRASSLVYVACVFGALVAGGGAIGALPVAALVGLMVAVARHTFSWSSLRLLGRCRAADAATILLVSALTVGRGLATAVAAGIFATSLRFAYDASFDLYSAHADASGERTVDLYGTLFFGSASGFADHVAPTRDDRASAGRCRR
jgi:SulP family sulfate permease